MKPATNGNSIDGLMKLTQRFEKIAASPTSAGKILQNLRSGLLVPVDVKDDVKPSSPTEDAGSKPYALRKRRIESVDVARDSEDDVEISDEASQDGSDEGSDEASDEASEEAQEASQDEVEINEKANDEVGYGHDEVRNGNDKVGDSQLVTPVTVSQLKEAKEATDNAINTMDHAVPKRHLCQSSFHKSLHCMAQRSSKLP